MKQVSLSERDYIKWKELKYIFGFIADDEFVLFIFDILHSVPGSFSRKRSLCEESSCSRLIKVNLFRNTAHEPVVTPTNNTTVTSPSCKRIKILNISHSADKGESMNLDFACYSSIKASQSSDNKVFSTPQQPITPYPCESYGKTVGSKSFRVNVHHDLRYKVFSTPQQPITPYPYESYGKTVGSKSFRVNVHHDLRYKDYRNKVFSISEGADEDETMNVDSSSESNTKALQNSDNASNEEFSTAEQKSDFRDVVNCSVCGTDFVGSEKFMEHFSQRPLCRFRLVREQPHHFKPITPNPREEDGKRVTRKSFRGNLVENMHHGLQYKNSRTDDKERCVPKPVKQYPCKDCGKIFKNLCYKNLHVRAIHQGVQYKCRTCDKKYKTVSQRNAHELFIHINKRKMHGCKECGRHFPLESKLKYHISACHGEEADRTCTYCEKVLTTVNNRKKHEDVVHRNIRPNMCDTCDSSFATIYDLRDHKLLSHGTEEEKLLVSMKLSQRPTSYKCKKCDRIFATAWKRLLHLSSDHGIGTSVCSLCGRTFPSPSKLNSHFKKYHDTSEDKKTCSFCNKVFATAQIKARHENIVHKVTLRHLCNICGKVYAIPCHLSRHIQASHPNS